MSNPTSHSRRYLEAGCLLPMLFITAVPHLVGAQMVNVKIDFTNSELSDAKQAEMVQKVQTLFNNSGIGSADDPGIAVFNGGNPAEPKVLVGFVNRPTARWYGNSDKRGHSAVVNIATFTNAFKDLDQRCRAMAETLAHEVGHTLCATHDCEGQPNNAVKGYIYDANAPDGRQEVQCKGTPPTLMSSGICVPMADRGRTPGGAVAPRGFSQTSVEQIKKAIQTFVATGQDPARGWNLNASYENGIIELGGEEEGDVTVEGEIRTADCRLIGINYHVISGDESEFDFGWLNDAGTFIQPLPVDLDGTHLEAEPGSYLHFALRGRSGTEFQGIVFPQKAFGALEFSGFAVGAYFSRVQIAFSIEDREFIVQITSEEWNTKSGFGPALPKLAVILQGDGQVRITWPVGATGFNLQSSDGTGGPWTDVAGATNPHIVVAGGAERYFRLTSQ